jgi:branched-chain amino acid aminotransferase
MSFGTGRIWMNGELVDWADAKIHIGSHVIHYGSGVFEGARCYDTPDGAAVFRLDAHVRRLYDSAKIYRMDYQALGQDEFHEAILDTIRANRYNACYIRPLIYRGYDTLGVNPFSCPVEAAILVWEWGAYLGDDALEHGVDVQVSSWGRGAPNRFPSVAKSTANYANSQLIKMEATLNGYAEGIALDPRGFVSEGSGQNIFAVRNGVITTPPSADSILPGITRDVVITLAGDLGFEVREETLPREALYIADEVFFTGTAAEISPIRSIDKIPIGSGKRGPMTAAIQRRFFDVINGRVADTHGWLKFVYGDPAAVTPATAGAAAGAG